MCVNDYWEGCEGSNMYFSLGSWAMMLLVLVVTMNVGIHPRYAGDPMCLCPDLATTAEVDLEVA
jgi:hypothetical protein